MNNKWENLRGQDLSAFITNEFTNEFIKNTDQEPHDFYKHLGQYGTVEDFNNVMEEYRQHCPYSHTFGQSLSLAKHFPQAAKQWLIAELPKVPSSYDAHAQYAIVISVIYGLSKDFLDFANFNKMSFAHFDYLFLELVRTNLKDVVETHWDLFVPSMVNRTDQKVIEAAAVGLDLAPRINWQPTEKNSEEYFMCCCQGGLLDNAKNIKVSSSSPAIGAAFRSTLDSHPQNMEEVLEYLWETYPDTPWYKEKNILSKVYRESPSFVPRFIEHFKIHAPGMLPENFWDEPSNKEQSVESAVVSSPAPSKKM